MVGIELPGRVAEELDSAQLEPLCLKPLVALIHSTQQSV